MQYARAYRECLSESQREALRTASVTYVDECFEALEEVRRGLAVAETQLGYHLPTRYAHRYDLGFARSWLVSVITVGNKLAQPRRIKLTCVAEELALNAIAIEARSTLEGQSAADNKPDWDCFYDWIFEDKDWKFLFDPAYDGIEDGPSAARFDIVNLDFASWFVPFNSSYTRPHPFTID